jgi:putative FmdB family regulatory protein
MPLYEYQCTQCSKRHEIIQKFSDPPMAQCPSCGGDVKKLFSSPAIQFKGSGFYKTDYPSSSAKESKSSGTSTETKSESKTETASESKTETKTESKSETKSESKASSSE